jgi:hypothetical protein
MLILYFQGLLYFISNNTSMWIFVRLLYICWILRGLQKKLQLR